MGNDPRGVLDILAVVVVVAIVDVLLDGSCAVAVDGDVDAKITITIAESHANFEIVFGMKPFATTSIGGRPSRGRVGWRTALGGCTLRKL